MTRPLVLSPDLEAIAETFVEAGAYNTVEEVVGAALDLLKAHYEKRARLVALVEEGYRSAETERTYSVEEAFAEIDELLGREERERSNGPA